MNELSPRQQEALASFAYHKPSEDQVRRIANVRRGLRYAAEVVILNSRECADQTVALRKLHEAMMDTNKAIVRETPERAEPIRPPEATSWARRGMEDCYQDRCENVPFASVGGLDKRASMQRPAWVPEQFGPDYFEGYGHAARELYGEDWQTCQFGWQRALTIPSPEIGPLPHLAQALSEVPAKAG